MYTNEWPREDKDMTWFRHDSIWITDPRTMDLDWSLLSPNSKEVVLWIFQIKLDLAY